VASDRRLSGSCLNFRRRFPRGRGKFPHQLRLVREYLESRELTLQDLAFVERRSRELIAQARSRSAFPDVGSEDYFSPLRGQDFAQVHGELSCS
jgi:hypothetical protein